MCESIGNVVVSVVEVIKNRVGVGIWIYELSWFESMVVIRVMVMSLSVRVKVFMWFFSVVEWDVDQFFWYICLVLIGYVDFSEVCCCCVLGVLCGWVVVFWWWYCWYDCGMVFDDEEMYVSFSFIVLLLYVIDDLVFYVVCVIVVCIDDDFMYGIYKVDFSEDDELICVVFFYEICLEVFDLFDFMGVSLSELNYFEVWVWVYYFFGFGYEIFGVDVVVWFVCIYVIIWIEVNG